MSQLCRICLGLLSKNRIGHELICNKCIDSLSFCPHCFCMSYTVDNKCGKCKKEKLDE